MSDPFQGCPHGVLYHPGEGGPGRECLRCRVSEPSGCPTPGAYQAAGRIADQDRKIEALEAENARLVALLRKHAYKINSPDDGGECIECGQWESEGHYGTCEISALLAEIDGGSNETN